MRTRIILFDRMNRKPSKHLNNLGLEKYHSFQVKRNNSYTSIADELDCSDNTLRCLHPEDKFYLSFERRHLYRKEKIQHNTRKTHVLTPQLEKEQPRRTPTDQTAGLATGGDASVEGGRTGQISSKESKCRTTHTQKGVGRWAMPSRRRSL